MNANSTELSIVAPLVRDGNDPILSYELNISKKPYAELTADQKSTQITTKECNFSTTELQNVSEIECKLVAGTDIQPNDTYYLTIFPKKNSLLGNPSKEIMFNYSTLLAATNNTISTGTSHSAAPDMCTANISWSQDNEKVTVTWDALTKNGKIRIEARGQSESSFKPYGVTDITAEKYVFIPSQSGTYIVKIVPLDNNNKEHGKPCLQTMHLQDFTVTEIKTQTGPKETLMIIGLIAVIG